MTSTPYTFRLHDRWLGQPVAISLLHDRDETTEAALLAASGDCFATLATELDELAQTVPADSAEYVRLERIIATMLELQRSYQITKK